MKDPRKHMKDPLGVSPSKGNQGTKRGKEKILLTSVTLVYTSDLILCSTICVHSATRHNIHMYMKNRFSYSGATLWNSLPYNIRESSSLHQFKRLLHQYF